MLSGKWFGYHSHNFLVQLYHDITYPTEGVTKNIIGSWYDVHLVAEVYQSELIRSLLEKQQEE